MQQIIKIVKTQQSSQNHTTPDNDQSAWAKDMGQFIYHLHPDTWKITRSLENIKLKLINSVPSPLTKLAWIITCCLNIHSLKKWKIEIYIYIYKFDQHHHSYSTWQKKPQDLMSWFSWHSIVFLSICKYNMQCKCTKTFYCSYDKKIYI